MTEPSTDSARPGIARTLVSLRDRIGRWRGEGARIALVPTMGALHEGHLSLVRIARQQAERVVVSIFVNPSQFGPGEDFASYPRREAQDLDALAGLAELAYIPTPEDMYPDGFATTVHVAGVTEGLCGAHRPGHFDGVTTVVTKLLTRCRPDIAVFGEKDYQQLVVIRRLVRDLDLGVDILAGPTVRDADGLALSSRNAYLSPAERRVAVRLNQILAALAACLAQAGTEPERALAAARAELEAAGFDAIDYLELRDAETLAPIDRPIDESGRPARVLAAVHVGRTRLIDNMEVASPDPSPA